jgi:dihydrofolate synthase/folylpolyglutamate synthase
MIEKELGRYGSKPGLGRITRVMDALGNPQKDLRIVMVGGTNGKGSTAAYISSILREEGYTVGTFISPHTVSPRERYQLDGRWIPEEKLGEYEKEMLGLHEEGYEMTMWEAYAAIAYRYFRDEKVDFAVMEVMMGGKYDAVNVADAHINVITNVSLDHTEFLGDNIEEIAEEKAGIIKRGVCITGADEESAGIIKRHADSARVPLRMLGRDFFSEVKELETTHTVFDYVGRNFYLGLRTSLPGDHQAFNGSLAVAVAEELGISDEAIRRGLERAEHPGRMQLVNEKPRIIVDAAHNPDGIGTLIANLHLYDYDKLIVVFAVKKTKDWMRMVELLAPHASLFVSTTVDGQYVEPSELKDKAGTFTQSAARKDVRSALRLAIEKCGENDLILVCGSIYLLQRVYGLKGAGR